MQGPGGKEHGLSRRHVTLCRGWDSPLIGEGRGGWGFLSLRDPATRWPGHPGVRGGFRLPPKKPPVAALPSEWARGQNEHRESDAKILRNKTTSRAHRL